MTTYYNVEIREFNGVDYDVLRPLTIMQNVAGLPSALSDLSNSIGEAFARISHNQQNIEQLQTETSGFDDSIQQINEHIDYLDQDMSNIRITISDLNENKQDKDELGALAFKNKVSLTNNTDISGTLPTANGGTGNTNGTVPKLTTARTIRTNLASTSTASFDGSANVTPGVTGVLPAANGGTGNANGTIDKLTTARTIRTNLGSTSTASFDGSANVTPGVTGVLSIAHGGTGASSASSALTNLGVTISNTAIQSGDSLAAGTIYIYYQ